MEITGIIQSIKYEHKLSNTEYKEYNISELNKALENNSKFLLNVDKINKFAVSWWVSPKRTRSYPYARVYDTLAYAGKRITIIPIYKDEGKDGDRDFLQWDTVSLMSLLGVNVIISYYERADRKKRYNNKITNQRFNVEHISNEIKNLVSYQSDALHWNLEQVEDVTNLMQKAVEAYKQISSETKVIMHSEQKISEKIELLKEHKDNFMNLSRKLSQTAQNRERITIQPKENINTGEKAKITISNYLGGYYYFTADEARISNDEGREIINLVEGKHSSNGKLPSLDDIKDGLIKMMLFSNLNKVKVDDEEYEIKPILKLTGAKSGKLSLKQSNILCILKKESEINKFSIEYIGGIADATVDS